ncbi:hypothetical protein NH340_JMT00093 [Sarcoptes scabiei]|nr:hypothetical protein NH340_JMT00093 [Sarcoptes scabiei]
MGQNLSDFGQTNRFGQNYIPYDANAWRRLSQSYLDHLFESDTKFLNQNDLELLELERYWNHRRKNCNPIDANSDRKRLMPISRTALSPDILSDRYSKRPVWKNLSESSHLTKNNHYRYHSLANLAAFQPNRDQLQSLQNDLIRKSISNASQSSSSPSNNQSLTPKRIDQIRNYQSIPKIEENLSKDSYSINDSIANRSSEKRSNRKFSTFDYLEEPRRKFQKEKISSTTKIIDEPRLKSCFRNSPTSSRVISSSPSELSRIDVVNQNLRSEIKQLHRPSSSSEQSFENRHRKESYTSNYRMQTINQSNTFESNDSHRYDSNGDNDYSIRRFPFHNDNHQLYPLVGHVRFDDFETSDRSLSSIHRSTKLLNGPISNKSIQNDFSLNVLDRYDGDHRKGFSKNPNIFMEFFKILTVMLVLLNVASIVWHCLYVHFTSIRIKLGQQING